MNARAIVGRKLQALQAEVLELDDASLGVLVDSGALDKAILFVRHAGTLRNVARLDVGQVVKMLAGRFLRPR